jgi:hypothetical protein
MIMFFLLYDDGPQPSTPSRTGSELLTYAIMVDAFRLKATQMAIDSRDRQALGNGRVR